MKISIKSILIIGLIFLTSFAKGQSKNIFIGRTFWKSNPTVLQLKQKIKEGHSATALNRSGFDAVVYALLENANTEVIKHLLSIKENSVNKLTHDGRTYIFWAAYKNNYAIVEHLLAKGAKTDIIDDKGYSVLNFTAAAGVENAKLYDLLIAHGANPLKEKTPKGANPLLLIVPNLSNLKMVKYFTDKGLDLNSTDYQGNGAFNYTAQKGNKKMLAILIKKGLPYKNLNNNGGNAMLFATKGSRSGYNSLGFIKYLESLGVRPNITAKDGTTPLHNFAYGNKDTAAINYFITKGINVNQTDKNGNTVLINAASRNSIEVIKILASKTSNINHQNKQGQTALTRAIRNSSTILKYLIENGADVQIEDKKGNHLGYYLFNTFNPSKLTEFNRKLALLKKNGLTINRSQKNGNSLYHLAVKKQQLSLLEYIHNYPIDINLVNNENLTALQLAVMMAKDDKILKFLIANGANKNVKTDFNETLFDLAKENEALKGIDISFLK